MSGVCQLCVTLFFFNFSCDTEELNSIAQYHSTVTMQKLVSFDDVGCLLRLVPLIVILWDVRVLAESVVRSITEVIAMPLCDIR